MEGLGPPRNFGVPPHDPDRTNVREALYSIQSKSNDDGAWESTRDSIPTHGTVRAGMSVCVAGAPLGARFHARQPPAPQAVPTTEHRPSSARPAIQRLYAATVRPTASISLRLLVLACADAFENHADASSDRPLSPWS